MKYNEFTSQQHKIAQRVGRGIAAGQGKTAGRGTKGQNARTGARKKPGFEGGQNPLMQRLPKLRGFRSSRAENEVVNTGQLANFKITLISNETLAEAGLTSSPFVNVKLIINGEVSKKLNVKLQSASDAAIKAIEKAGGGFEQVPRLGRQASNKLERRMTSKQVGGPKKMVRRV